MNTYEVYFDGGRMVVIKADDYQIIDGIVDFIAKSDTIANSFVATFMKWEAIIKV